MPDSAIQPILCCVGQAVAGRPTQFIMEKAFDDCGLDWRAITVQVAEDQFVDAVRGMCAMRFSAIRFFDSAPSGALEFLGGEQAFQGFVGEVTSAAYRHANATWEVWHNSGFGLLAAVSQRCPPADCTYLLAGDSIQTRSLYVAMHALGLGERILWSSPPTAIPCEARNGVDVEQPKTLPAVSDAGFCDAIGEMAELSGTGERPRLVLVGETWGISQEQLGELADQHHLMWIESETRADRYAEGMTVIPQIDCLVAAEAYDFARWTGRSADLQVMREAYEEYCDF